jgi:hypothetical protein
MPSTVTKANLVFADQAKSIIAAWIATTSSQWTS